MAKLESQPTACPWCRGAKMVPQMDADDVPCPVCKGGGVSDKPVSLGTGRKRRSFIDGDTLMVPEAFAKRADARAFEIFEREMRFDQPFRKCLGQIYMVGVQAGIVAARGIKSDE